MSKPARVDAAVDPIATLSSEDELFRINRKSDDGAELHPIVVLLHAAGDLLDWLSTAVEDVDRLVE